MDKDTHIGRAEARLGEWGAAIDDLVVRCDDLGEDARKGYREIIEELKHKHQVLRARLEEAREARHERWESFEKDLVKASEDLEAAFAGLAKR